MRAHNFCRVVRFISGLSLTFFFLLASVSISSPLAATDTVTVSAEGLADPGAEKYHNNKDALNDALLEDAKKQAIEKVVGMYVSTKSLEENYQRIEDGVLTKTGGFIKKIIQKSEPWRGEDGLMHILIKAEVYTSKAKVALDAMNRNQRLQLLREFGNPKISVAIVVRDHDRQSNVEPQRSPIAENILKEHITEFGYRVWSEEVGSERNEIDAQKALAAGKNEQAVYYGGRKSSDFIIRGDVKFKQTKLKLQTTGMEITKISLTSWTVKCIDSITGEELYFNNTIPSRKSWNTEDEALNAIGTLMGKEFSREFFEQHLMRKTAIYELEVQSLPVYEAAVLFKKELIGLRPVLNVDLKSYDSIGGAVYEVELSGREPDFSEYLNENVLIPLNYKFGHRAFSLISVQKQLIKIAFKGSKNSSQIITLFQKTPPSSLAMASPVRLNQIAATKRTLDKVEEINPKGVEVVREHRRTGGKTSLEAIRDF